MTPNLQTYHGLEEASEQNQACSDCLMSKACRHMAHLGFCGEQTRACLLDSPSHLRMLVKTQVVAGMLSPMANVSVANKHCTTQQPVVNKCKTGDNIHAHISHDNTVRHSNGECTNLPYAIHSCPMKGVRHIPRAAFEYRGSQL